MRLIRFALFALVAMLVLRAYAIEAFVMRTDAAAPRVQIGDRVLVSKLSTPHVGDVVAVYDFETARPLLRVYAAPGPNVPMRRLLGVGLFRYWPPSRAGRL